jgi:hypothetical protein
VKFLLRSAFVRIATLLVFSSLFLVPIANAALQVQIGQNFAGSDNTQTFITPADGNGAIGPKHFVEFINGFFCVYAKTNGLRTLRISDLQFWANAGVIISSDAMVSDPRVIYDPSSQRWFASQVDLNANASDPTLYANNFLIAVSDTASPTGSWHGKSFIADPDTGYFADFPTIGVDANALYISGDFFLDQNTPVGPGLWSIPKADLLINNTPAIVTNATWYGVMTYAERGDVLQPATCVDGSGTGDILGVGDIFSGNTIIASKVLNGDTINATLQPPLPISVAAYTVPIDPKQPDGTDTLADNDARLSAKAYTVGGIIYAVHNIEVNARAAIRWYRISATNQTLLESGTITDPGLDLFFPSIAATANGIMIIGCNGSSLTQPVSSYAFAGQIVNGVTSFGAPILLQAGTISNYHDSLETSSQATESRWGDYSATSVDPTDPSRFWTIQMLPLDSGTWVTHITEVIVVPQLSIAAAGTNVNLTWPLFAASYQLQTTTDPSQLASWVPVTTESCITTNADQISTIVPQNGTQQFFRLIESQ